MKRNTYFIIGAIVLMVVAIVLIVVGVLTHDEPGFAVPHRGWEQTPLTVVCRGYTSADDEACESAVKAMELVNERLGFDIFVERSGPVDVEIVMRAPVEVGERANQCGRPGECYRLDIQGDTYTRCHVQTMNISGGADNDLELLAVYHGLGHCLGLAHDDYEQSIMRPVQTPTEWGQLRPWISDYDRKLLRERYR